jgi:hypothetical protein
MFKWMHPFFEAADSSAGGTVLEDFEVLNDDTGDDEVEKDPKVEKEEGEGEEDKEEEEKEEKEEEVTHNELSIKALKEAFPELLKKFPDLKDSIFREREYTKIFGSVEDATEAQEKAQLLDQIAETTLQGDPTQLFSSLQKNDALEEFAVNFLPHLYKANEKVFYKITDDIMARALNAANSHATKRSDKNLTLAVKYISTYIFNSEEVPKAGVRKEVSPERQELENEREKDRQAKYTETEDFVHSVTRNRLDKSIREGLDPDESMSDFVKGALVDKIIEDVGSIIEKDKIFQSQMISLWKRASKEGFSKDAKSRIITAYLARARRIIPSVRAKIRNEAGSSVNKDGKQLKKDLPTGGSGKKNNQLSSDPKKVDWKRSDEELLGD